MALPGSPKQDRNGVRSAPDLERKYDFSSLVGIKRAIKINDEGLTKTNKILEEFIDATLGELGELQKQVDGKIETWFYEGEPTLDNMPACEWPESTYVEHQGDLYYDKLTGYAYRFLLEDGKYVWMKLSDSDVTEALAIANAAQDTADGKRRVFTSVPVPPYDNGDLWFNNKEIYICQISKGEGEIYEPKDFITATKYTDDTVANKVGDELTVVRGTVLVIQESMDTYKVEITTTVKGIGSELEVAKTSILANTNEIDLRVRKDGVIGAINLTSEVAKIQASKIELEGAVTINALDSNLRDRIDGYGTQLSVLNGQISAKIWQDDISSSIEDIEIGGRNRLVNSAEWDDYEPTLNSTSHKTSKVAVTPGEQITVGYDVKATEACAGQTLLVQYYGTETGTRVSYVWATADVTTEYTRKHITVTIPDNIYYMDIGLRSSQGIAKTYRKLKVESGNKATEWTAAPEDTDGQIATLKSRYAELQMDINGFRATVAAEYAPVSEVNNIKSKYTELETDINGFKATVKAEYAPVSEVNNIKSKYTELETDINGFKATVVTEYALIEDVNKIAVGGTNLLPDTNAPSLEAVSAKRNRYWSDSDNTTVKNEFIEISNPPVKGIKYGTRQTCTGIVSKGCNLTWSSTEQIALEDGVEYVLSCYARLTSGTKASLRFRMYEVGSQTSYLAVESAEWKRYSVTIRVNKATLGAEYCKIGIGIMSSYISTVEACGFKLEKGNKITDWSPAPTDADGQIKILSDKHSSLELSLGEFKTAVSSTYATTASVKTLEGQLVNYSTKVETQSALSVAEQTIMSSVSQTYTPLSDFNNLEIGASNILRYMNSYTEEKKYTMTANKDNFNKLTEGRAQLEAGVEYTFSCQTDGEWLTGSSGDTVEAYLLLDGKYSTYFGLPTNPCIFTPTKSGLYTLRFDVNQNGATHSFWNIQIEKGNRATDWRQNLLDAQAEVASIGTTATQTLEKFEWLVKSGTSAANFTLTDRMAKLTAQIISLNAEDVQISGDMILDGAITADKINVEDLYTLNAKIGGWDVKSTYIKNDALDSEGYVRRAFIQSMSAHEAENTWVFSIQKSQEPGDYDGSFNYVWRVFGNGDMDTKGHTSIGDVLKVYGGVNDNENSFIQGKLTVGGTTCLNQYSLYVIGSALVEGDVETTWGSLNDVVKRFSQYTSSASSGMKYSYGVSLPGLYIVLLIDSASSTARALPTVAYVYVASDGTGWVNAQLSTDTKITSISFSNWSLRVNISENRYLTIGIINLLK